MHPASGTVTANVSQTVVCTCCSSPILTFPNTPSGDVLTPVYRWLQWKQSPVCGLSDHDCRRNNAAAVSVAPLQKLHAVVCTEILDAVTAYYLVRNLDQVNTTEAINKLQTALNASLSGQLRNLYDAVVAAVPDDSAPEGTGGVVLFPANLKAAILNAITLWLNTFPDN